MALIVLLATTALMYVSVTVPAAASSNTDHTSPINACRFITLNDAVTMLGSTTSRVVADPPVCAYAAAPAITGGPVPTLSVKAWKNGPQRPIRGASIETKRLPIREARCWHTTFPASPTGVQLTPPVTTCFKRSRTLQISALGVENDESLISQATQTALQRM